MYLALIFLSCCCSVASALPTEKGFWAMNVWAVMFLVIGLQGLFMRVIR